MQTSSSSGSSNNNNNNGYSGLHISHHHSQRTSGGGTVYVEEEEASPGVVLMNGPANGNVVDASSARASSSCYDQQQQLQQPSSSTSKKTLPANGKKTKGRVKIKMEFIDNKLRRYTTFSKRKTGIMKKAYELSTLTGTQVMLLVASETGHVYTFATRKLQPMITSEAGKALIQTCLNSPDPPPGPGSSGLDQRMSATGFEETDLTYSVGDDSDKMADGGKYSSSPSSPQSGDASPSTSRHQKQLMGSSPSPPPSMMVTVAADHPSPSAVASSVVGHQQQQQVITTNAAGYATILSAAPVQIGGFSDGSEASLSTGGQTGSSPPAYRLPTQASPQSFSLSIPGAVKNQSTSSSGAQVPHANAISVVQNAQQNLSFVSGNVVIPAAQALLQSAGGNNNNSGNSSSTGNNSVQGAFMYHTAQGLVYAAPTSLPEGVILNLGQEQGTAPQQYITIPVSLSLTPAQQQLMQVSPATITAPCHVTGCSPAKKEKVKK